jgi:hypothetical protein
VLVAGLLLAGCGSDLPPTPTEPTWSTDSTSATASTTATPVSIVPTSTTVLAGVGAGVEDVDLRRPRRTTAVARPRPTTTTTTATATRRVVADGGTTTSRTTTSKTTTSKAPGKSYRSCAEASAAGAAPLFAGQPGYSRKLDRDNDGIACDV